MPAGAADHQRAHRGVGGEPLHPIRQRAQQRLVVGVGDLRPVQRQRGDAARIDIKQEYLVAHARLTFAGSVLAPQTRTPTRAPAGGA